MASLYYYDLAELVEELVIQIDTPLFHIESNGAWYYCLHSMHWTEDINIQIRQLLEVDMRTDLLRKS